jgi:hypothetical protein
MTEERPKSSEEMLRAANHRLRAPQDDPVPEPPSPVRPPPPPPEAPREIEELKEDYKLDELVEIERESELDDLSPEHGPTTKPYGPDPSGRPDRGSRFSRLALRFGLGIVVFAGIGFFSSLDDASRDGSGDLVGAGDLDVMALQVGDCFNDPEELEEVVFSVAAVPCSEAHDNEVYAAIPYTLSGFSFPGDTRLQTFGYEACVGQPFSEYVGTDYFDSSLEVFIFTPTEESWNTGDRNVTCILYKLDLTKLTGTARDSGL